MFAALLLRFTKLRLIQEENHRSTLPEINISAALEVLTQKAKDSFELPELKLFVVSKPHKSVSRNKPSMVTAPHQGR